MNGWNGEDNKQLKHRLTQECKEQESLANAKVNARQHCVSL